MSYLAPSLALVATLWPAWLWGAFIEHRDRHPSWLSVGAYLVAARVCHQRSDRSFWTDGHQWPVCGRCAGLYLSAPAGSWAAWVWARRRQAVAARTEPTLHPRRRGAALALGLAATPTLVSVVAESLWPDAVQSWHRFAAALPLGFALAAVVILAALGGERSVRYTDAP